MRCYWFFFLGSFGFKLDMMKNIKWNPVKMQKRIETLYDQSNAIYPDEWNGISFQRHAIFGTQFDLEMHFNRAPQKKTKSFPFMAYFHRFNS